MIKRNFTFPSYAGDCEIEAVSFHPEDGKIRGVIQMIHGMMEHMKKHAAILRPKFEVIENTLEEELGGLGVGEWSKPYGGYFIFFQSLDGCAKAIVKRCMKCGVKMTPAGSTWPYRKDPYDKDIRIAPSYPPIEDLRIAAKLFALSVKIVSAEKILAEMPEA